MTNQTFPITEAGRIAALAAVGGDKSRLWYDVDQIRILPPDAVPVPQEVTRAQAKIALSRAGKLDAAQSAVEAVGGETLLWWQEALTIRRDHPAVIALGPVIGLTPAQLDALFVAAATIA